MGIPVGRVKGGELEGGKKRARSGRPKRAEVRAQGEKKELSKYTRKALLNFKH
jgi:hypothetical protein